MELSRFGHLEPNETSSGFQHKTVARFNDMIHGASVSQE